MDTLASATGEDATTIEDVYEPYLIQLGFIARTPRGRVALKGAYEHLNLPLSKAQINALSIYETSGDVEWLIIQKEALITTIFQRN